MDRPSPASLLPTALDATHPLVQLATTLNWSRIVAHFDDTYPKVPGTTRLPGRILAALIILRELYDLSDEQLHRQWRENPYFQYFCGFREFQHVVPFDPILLRLAPRMTSFDLSRLTGTSWEAAPVLAQAADGKAADRVPPQEPTPETVKSASIYDVARMAGVSIKTVSLVLNNRDNVSERTAATVRDVIMALNYKPDMAARRLAWRKSVA